MGGVGDSEKRSLADRQSRATYKKADDTLIDHLVRFKDAMSNPKVLVIVFGITILTFLVAGTLHHLNALDKELHRMKMEEFSLRRQVGSLNGELSMVRREEK